MKTLSFVPALLCLSLLASACATGSSVVSSTATIAAEPTAQLTPAPTQPPAPAEPPAPAATLDLDGLAQAVATLVLPAVQPGADNPLAVAMPQSIEVK